MRGFALTAIPSMLFVVGRGAARPTSARWTAHAQGDVRLTKKSGLSKKKPDVSSTPRRPRHKPHCLAA
jgi:hypothetical protein